MSISKEVRAFVALGPLPADSTASVEAVAAAQTHLFQIKPPVTLDEARLLMTCFGPDDCFGLASTLIQVIESCPNVFELFAEEPPESANWGVRRLWERQRNALKRGN